MLGSNPEFLIWSVSDLGSRISKRFPDGLNYSQIYKASFVSVIVKLRKVKKILFGGLSNYNMGFPGGASGKEFNCQCRRHRRWRFHPWVRSSISPEEEMVTHCSILAWKIPKTEETGGYSPCGCKEVDMTEQLRAQATYAWCYSVPPHSPGPRSSWLSTPSSTNWRISNASFR